MSATARVEYDRVLYPGAAFPQTHPDRLATLATLFGMAPVPVECARVLEIGCTDGGNLIPMAYHLPEAEFVGIDVSARALGAGRECIAALGLRNISLRELDILEVPRDFGAFDYIIAHGIYSWVPEVVRDKILAICRAHLAANGVAYISYNAYPGSHLRDLTRNMMLYHVGEIHDPDAKRTQALALLRFLIDAQPEANLFQKILEGELDRIDKASPHAFYHDDIAGTRAAFYFHEFIAAAAKHELQYLSEADIFDMEEQSFAPRVVEALHAQTTDRIAREQYLDFLECRRFRQTLLCHRAIALESPRGETVRSLQIFSEAKPLSKNPVLDEGFEEEFAVPRERGARLKTKNSAVKAVLVELARLWPRHAQFNELFAVAEQRSAEQAEGTSTTASDLADALLAMYRAGLVELHTSAPRFAVEVSDRPVASSLVQWRLARGETDVTNLRHRRVRCDDPIAMQLVALLDGTRDRETLVRELALFCQERGLLRDPAGGAITERHELASLIANGLEENLQKLARRCLLIA